MRAVISAALVTAVAMVYYAVIFSIGKRKSWGMVQGLYGGVIGASLVFILYLLTKVVFDY